MAAEPQQPLLVPQPREGQQGPQGQVPSDGEEGGRRAGGHRRLQGEDVRGPHQHRPQQEVPRTTPKIFKLKVKTKKELKIIFKEDKTIMNKLDIFVF